MEFLKCECGCGKILTVNGDKGWIINLGNFPQFVCKCGNEMGAKINPPKSDGERNDSAQDDKKALNIPKDTINVEEAAKSLEVPGKISSLPDGKHNK